MTVSKAYFAPLSGSFLRKETAPPFLPIFLPPSPLSREHQAQCWAPRRLKQCKHSHSLPSRSCLCSGETDPADINTPQVAGIPAKGSRDGQDQQGWGLTGAGWVDQPPPGRAGEASGRRDPWAGPQMLRHGPGWNLPRTSRPSAILASCCTPLCLSFLLGKVLAATTRFPGTIPRAQGVNREVPSQPQRS